MAGVRCMSWRRKKLEIGNSLSNYCNSWVRTHEELIRAVAIGTEERNTKGETCAVTLLGPDSYDGREGQGENYKTKLIL